jgi:hypothetical protein
VADFAARQADWDESYEDLSSMIRLANSSGYPSNYFPQTAIILSDDESVMGVFRPVALVQPRVGPSTTVTNYGAFSYQLTKNTRIRSGQYRSTHTPGTEAAKMLDEGVAVITDKRVYFQGNMRAHEWQLRRVSGVINNADEPWTSIAVGGREKVSGLRYAWEDAVDFRFKLNWALGLSRGNVQPLIASLERELAALGQRPGAEESTAAVHAKPPSPPNRGLFDDIAEGIERGDFTG